MASSDRTLGSAKCRRNAFLAGDVEPMKDDGETLRGELLHRRRAGALLARGEVELGAAHCRAGGRFRSRCRGSAAWRAERVPPGPGQKPDVVVRTEIEILEQKVRVSMSLRRNDNPVGHIVEIVFTLPPDFPHGGILIIPGIRMKEGEATPPVPLTAIGSRVAANFFRVGLPDGASNTQRLKEQPWFEIPVIYATTSEPLSMSRRG